MNAKQLLAEVEAKRQRYRDLRAEEQAIISESTEFRLQTNRQAQRQTLSDMQDLEKQANRMVAAKGKSTRETELVELLQDNHRQQTALVVEAVGMPGRGMPEKYLRVDAVQHFEAEAKKLRKQAADLHAKYTGRNRSPGPRILKEIEELEGYARDIEVARPLQLIGQKVARLREERRDMEAELEQVRKQHREAVLAAS